MTFFFVGWLLGFGVHFDLEAHVGKICLGDSVGRFLEGILQKFLGRHDVFSDIPQVQETTYLEDTQNVTPQVITESKHT